MAAPPNVDAEYLVELINSSTKVQGTFHTSDAWSFLLKGNSPIPKRMIHIRKLNGDKTVVTFDNAVAIAFRVKKMDELMTWLKDKKGYTHG